MAYRQSYIGQEFDDFMANMETQFNELLEELASTKALPGKGVRARLLPALKGEFRVDVKEHDDEVIVVADLPGAEKENVHLEVLDPRTLRIAFHRQAEPKEETEAYYVRERTFGNMDRSVMLPADVIAEGATATFNNGVLEVRLRKDGLDTRKKISIE